MLRHYGLHYSASIAWRVKENFRSIQFKQDRAAAVHMYDFWHKDALSVGIKEITDVVSTFDRHKTGIINAIETGANNAGAERLNGAIQELRTIGRGYKNIDNFRIVILFFYGDFKTAPH